MSTNVHVARDAHAPATPIVRRGLAALPWFTPAVVGGTPCAVRGEMLALVELAVAKPSFLVPRHFARCSFAVFLGMGAALAGSACGSDSALGACGYGAKLDTRYACEGTVQVTTREQCPPDSPVVTRKDCAASGKQCLELVGAGSGASKLFTCALPCVNNSDCPTDLYCARGFAATADGRSTCIPSLSEGFACDVSTACASGLVCALKPDGGLRDAAVRDAEPPDAATPAVCKPYTYLCECQLP